jgi:DNA-binding GntR family transcriptional regulator
MSKDQRQNQELPGPNGSAGELHPLPEDNSNNADALFVYLREAILTGVLVPDEEISQVQLATTLGVSRTPLREALRMLQHEGLVEARPNRRIKIAAFSLDDCEQLYVMRILLEGEAIRLTVPGITPERIADLEGLVAQMTHFADREDYLRWEVPHRAFHRLLIESAGKRITDAAAELSDHALRYRQLYTTQVPRAWSHGAEEHRKVLDAVEAGEPDIASRRLVAHLARTAWSVFDWLNPEYEPRALNDTVEHLIGPNPDEVWK